MTATRVSPDRLLEVLTPVVAALGADLEDVEVAAAGRRRRVRVVVDAVGGVDLDAVAAISQAVSRALDEGEHMGDQPYVLEVTSPGVDRPLTLPRHWSRNVGRRITVTTADGTTQTARLLAVDDGVATLEPAIAVRLDTVTRAVVELEFTRAED